MSDALIAQFHSDLEKMQLVVDTLASIGDSCEAPVAIHASEALHRMRAFPDALCERVERKSYSTDADGRSAPTRAAWTRVKGWISSQ